MANAAPTKQRILDAAEMLFAKYGFAGASMRQITKTAGVNLAAVNYHFGSKARLIEAVFERRIRPLNEERLVRLDAVLAKRGGIEEILHAFLSPAFEMLASGDEKARQFVRLLARSYTDEVAATEKFMDRLYADALGRFKRAAAGALPDIPQDELMWRLHFVAGAVSYAMAGRDVLGLITQTEAQDADAMSRRLLPFLVAGLGAPLPARQSV